MPRPAVAPPESTVETACPLDCPDACSLTVTLRGGRITKIDGSTANEVTRGYICAKVRRFDQRVYGEDRLLYPAIRRGAKGEGKFVRATWDDALNKIAENLEHTIREHGAESVLPLCYGGSNGMLTQDYADAILFRRLGTSRLLRTVCAAPTGAANMGLYGKMASVVYQDYPAARLILVWGVNPGASGIHLMPYLKEARDNGATIVVIDPRATTRGPAGRHPPGGAARAPIWSWPSPFTVISSRRASPIRRFSTRTRPARSSCASGRGRGRSNAPPRSAACPPIACGRWRRSTRGRARRW